MISPFHIYNFMFKNLFVPLAMTTVFLLPVTNLADKFLPDYEYARITDIKENNQLEFKLDDKDRYIVVNKDSRYVHQKGNSIKDIKNKDIIKYRLINDKINVYDIVNK